MFKEIVIGTDVQEGGRDALALAKRLAAPDATLILTYISVGDPLVYRTDDARHMQEFKDQTLALLGAAGAAAGVDVTTRFVASTSPGRGLHELAEHEQADLLVVGSSRRSLLGRVLMGDDTNAALNAAPCAVAVAPAGYADETGDIDEIGVGYDGSPESLQALEVARRLAGEFGARLSAFEAIALPRDPASAGTRGVEAGDIEELLVQARRRISELGDVEPHAAYGFPAEELGLYSASVDLLVVGSRGYGPVGRLIHGSTSWRLTRTARCPVLVLSRAARMPS